MTDTPDAAVDSGPDVLTATAQGRLRSIIERVERLEEDKAAVLADIKEAFAEASVPAGRQIIGATMSDEDAMAFLEMHALEPLRDPLQPHAFSVGDVVRLKSGGHRMTIIKLRTSEATCADPTAGALQEVDVAWSHRCANTGDSIETDTLDIAVIESAPDVLPHEREFSF